MGTRKGLGRDKVRRPLWAHREGLTSLEVLAASTIFLIVLFAIYLMYESNEASFAKGEVKTELQQVGRTALDTMTRDLRLAGYGVPGVPCPGTITAIASATATPISFLADLENVSTSLSAAANTNAASLSVSSVSGFAVNNSIYLTEGSKCQPLSVTSVDTTNKALGISPGLSASYGTGSLVTRPRTVAYAFSQGTITRDLGDGTGAQVLAEKVQSLTLQYFDQTDTEILPATLSSNLGNIRRIKVTVAVAGAVPRQGVQTYTLTSDVRLRNLP